MRILHVVEPFSSGIITFIINISKALEKHEHIVIHGTRMTADEMELVRNRFDPSVKFHVWKYARRYLNPIYDLMALFHLMLLLKRISFDVVHLHSSKAGFHGRLACFLLGIKPVIYTPNSAPFIRKDISNFKRWIYVFLEKFGNSLAGELVACGKSEQDVYADIGINVDYINNGVKITPYLRRSVRSKINVSFFGIATSQKNPKLFNEIALHFRNHTNVKFNWIGDGALRPQLQEDVINVSGWLKNNEQVNYVMKNVDIYLSTSTWEGQPFSVLEAMNEGKCLLLYDCPGNRDLVYNNENGYLFKSMTEAVQRIKFLLENPSEIMAMGRNSHRLCSENHDMVEMGRRYEEKYTSVLIKG